MVMLSFAENLGPERSRSASGTVPGREFLQHKIASFSESGVGPTLLPLNGPRVASNN